eukprot:Tbor_TRINITY_DN6127_c0_g2::TRINITY_DN6127_c0_g2_i6::g.21928::m.21928
MQIPSILKGAHNEVSADMTHRDIQIDGASLESYHELGNDVSVNNSTEEEGFIMRSKNGSLEARQYNKSETGKGDYLYDPEVSNITFNDALKLYYNNMEAKLKDDTEQNDKSYKDVYELEDHGVLLPHNPDIIADPKTYTACDARDADFTVARDKLCQEYLSNLNNIHSIKAISSILYRGRTLKFKVYYRHNNIKAIVKVSQKYFLWEASAEYLAYAVDRAINITAIPTTVFTQLPLDYMRAASGVLSPFYSQWWTNYILMYDYTESRLVKCSSATTYAEYLKLTDNSGDSKYVEKKLEKGCSLVAIQLWMNDLNAALDTYLAVPHEYSA